MNKLYFIILLAISYGCKSENYIKIRGEAINIKEGTAIISDNIYVLDNIEDWKDKQINREFIVRGKLIEVDYRYNADSVKIIPQSCNCIRKIILEPKYRITIKGLLKKNKKITF